MQEILIKAGCYVSIILLGWLLRRRGFFGPEAFGVLSGIVIRITLPCAIIASSAGRSIHISMLAISALGLGGGLAYMALGYLAYRKKNREQQAFAVLNTPGYNIGTFALPFTQSFLGPVGVLTTSLFDMGNSFICLGGAYGVAQAMKDGKGFALKRILAAPLRSIPFLTHLVMVTLNLLELDVPGPVLSFAGTVGNANAFLAMLMIGIGFHLSGDREQLGDIVRILGIRYGAAALLALGFFFLLPFDLEVRQALVILAFSPVGSAVPVFTAQLKGDVGLSSAINSISILCSTGIIVTLLVVML